MPIERAIMRHPLTDRHVWLAFESPIDSWEANSHDDVRAVVDQAAAANARGLWVVGMISYDAGPAFDSALASHRAPNVPLASFAAFDEAQQAALPRGGSYTVGAWKPTRKRSDYEADVSTVRELIAAGETYQINYTMRLEADFDGDPLGFFAAMARAQRSAEHLAYLDFGDRAASSASPELFIRREGRTVSSRPMKGTRPRHPDPQTDKQLAEDLLASEKDRAENTMIVDMVRNDLGRIAEVGSLRTTALHDVEQYSTVHQLTSTVEVDTDAGLFDTLAATFPAASITGAPKVNATRFIADLENTPRGLYTGTIGAMLPNGDYEFNVAIRTAWIDRSTQRASYGVGGGVVWDSDPTAEWHEAHDKARVLYRADQPFELLETLRWDPENGFVLLDRHLERLALAASHFGYDIDLAQVNDRLEHFTAEQSMVVRVTVDLDGDVTVTTRAVPDIPDRPTVVFDTEPLNRADEFLRHKTTRRTRYEQARARFPDAYDVVLWNRLGEICESTVANLIAEIDGVWVTPIASSALLPGTMRAEMLANGTVIEQAVTLEDLRRAAQIELVNSVRGRVPVDVDFTTAPDRLRVRRSTFG